MKIYIVHSSIHDPECLLDDPVRSVDKVFLVESKAKEYVEQMNTKPECLYHMFGDHWWYETKEVEE